MPKRTRLNNNFFSTRNMKSAYWAGFIAADGCIHDNKNVSIDLQYKDRSQIFKLKAALKHEGHVFERRSDKKFSRLAFKSEKIVIDLKRIYNISSRKSLTLKSPNIKQENIIRAFIRGFMDGDGSIYYYNNKRGCAVSFNGTKEMLVWVKSNIKKYIPELSNPTIIYNRPIHKLTFTGEQVARILDWIYIYSDAWTRLDRKYLKYKEMQICNELPF